jgi:hypothetical protein
LTATFAVSLADELEAALPMVGPTRLEPEPREKP